MRAAAHLRRSTPELGASETTLAVHRTHDVTASGACRMCGVRSTWPRIERPCANTANFSSKRDRRDRGSKSEAAVIARRAARLRGEQ